MGLVYMVCDDSIVLDVRRICGKILGPDIFKIGLSTRSSGPVTKWGNISTMSDDFYNTISWLMKDFIKSGRLTIDKINNSPGLTPSNTESINHHFAMGLTHSRSIGLTHSRPRGSVFSMSKTWGTQSQPISFGLTSSTESDFLLKYNLKKR